MHNCKHRLKVYTFFKLNNSLHLLFGWTQNYSAHLHGSHSVHHTENPLSIKLHANPTSGRRAVLCKCMDKWMHGWIDKELSMWPKIILCSVKYRSR